MSNERHVSFHDGHANPKCYIPHNEPVAKFNTDKNFSESRGNLPHECLEFPALYHVVRHWPWLKRNIRSLYRCRWSVSYPLQRRVPLSRGLRKMGVFLTWGELFLFLPMIGFLVWGVLSSFYYPSVTLSGHAARTPLALAFMTATHNSVITFLLGMPFERSLFYHKLCGRIAFINGIMHTYAAFIDTDDTTVQVAYGNAGIDDLALASESEHFMKWAFTDQINSSGTMLLTFITFIVLTSLPYIRHKIFELFYYIHIAFAFSMVICAFYHSGITVVILASVVWGGDMIMRKLVMACCMHPVRATISLMTDSVIEIKFIKTKSFNYNPGQYVFLSVPEISLFQWHPFSLSSSPHSDHVTLHIRRAGNWTGELYKLAQRKRDISILFEGPYGSVGVDLTSDRYKMIMLLSGGIGVTPMQSITHQLMHEHENHGRDLKKIWFVWSARDPRMMNEMAVVRRKSERDVRRKSVYEDDETSHRGDPRVPRASRIAETLLTRVRVSHETDHQIEQDLPLDEYLEGYVNDEDDAATAASMKSKNEIKMGNDDQMQIVPLSDADKEDFERRRSSLASSAVASAIAAAGAIDPVGIRDDDDEEFGDNSTITSAPTRGKRPSFSSKLANPSVWEDDDEFAVNDILDLKVFLTGNEQPGDLDYDFVSRGRPQMKDLFLQFRQHAIARNERRVAVCVCAPTRLVDITRHACVKYSNHVVQFDFHSEVFD